MSERMWKIESLFAEAKQQHNLSRAKYRGRVKVQIQAYLSAMAQNLKRLVLPVYQWLRLLHLSAACVFALRRRLQF
jgi:IS5 family transposase